MKRQVWIIESNFPDGEEWNPITMAIYRHLADDYVKKQLKWAKYYRVVKYVPAVKK
jgi:hypothetical protein